MARSRTATTLPAIYPISGARFIPPSLVGATRKKQVQINERNVAGTDIIQCGLLTYAKYAAHVHKVMVASNWLIIPT